jgi:hypothetical protein
MTARASKKIPTHEFMTEFLNVDLDLHAKQDLALLVKAFEPHASPLNCTAVKGGYFASLELAKQPTDAEAAIRSFVKLIKKLSPRSRALWNKTTKRDFSIGINTGSKPWSLEVPLSTAVLKLATDVGARIVFVVYAARRGMQK